MLKIILVSSFIYVSLFGKTINLPIGNVTVYSDRAEIERRGKIRLNTGYTNLKTAFLPAEILDNSVRIISDKGVNIQDIKVNTVYLDTLLDRRVKKKKKVLDSLKFEIKGMKDNMAVLMKKETFLDSITIISPKNISKNLLKGENNVEAWKNALKFIGNNLVSVKRKKRFLKRRIDKIQNRINKLQRELNEWSGKQKKVAKEISFPVTVKNNGKYNITIKYIVKNASWSVKYNIRAYPDENAIDIAYFGNIRQETGEDWNNVHITLSTSAPVIGGIPAPNPWTIHYAYPERKTAMKFDKTLSRYKGMLGQKKVSPAYVPPPAYIKSTDIAIVYMITGKKSIPSGKTPKKVLISKNRFKADFSYFAIPRISKNVYLKAKGENITNLIYLNGNANIFVESEYVGNISINKIAPQQKFEIPVGIDRRIQITHKLVKSLHEIRGTISKTEKWNFKFKTIVENYREKPISLTLIEQIPVSKEKDIRVKNIGFSPKQDSVDKNSGNYFWFLNLQSKEKFTVQQKFSVEWPYGKKIRELL